MSSERAGAPIGFDLSGGDPPVMVGSDMCSSNVIECIPYGAMPGTELPPNIPRAGIIVKGVDFGEMMPVFDADLFCRTLVPPDIDSQNACKDDLVGDNLPRFSKDGEYIGVKQVINDMTPDGKVIDNFGIIYEVGRCSQGGGFCTEIAGTEIDVNTLVRTIEANTGMTKKPDLFRDLLNDDAGAVVVFVLTSVFVLNAMRIPANFINNKIEKAKEKAAARQAERVSHESARDKLHRAWDGIGKKFKK